jgi:hypothetical protein
MKKKTTVLMAAVLAAVIALATGLAVLSTSVQDAQAQSCVTDGAGKTNGPGFTITESTYEGSQEGDIGKCSSDTSVTAERNNGGQTTSNEQEYEYEYEYEYGYEYEPE